jgi:hypothetical protein
LLPLLQEHLVDNGGEVLPHLFISDVARWLSANAGQQPDTARAVLSWLESERSCGYSDVDNLIDVSLVEMLPRPGEPGAEVRGLLGPLLAAEAERLSGAGQ